MVRTPNNNINILSNFRELEAEYIKGKTDNTDELLRNIQRRTNKLNTINNANNA